jgi:hypothetical protein
MSLGVQTRNGFVKTCLYQSDIFHFSSVFRNEHLSTYQRPIPCLRLTAIVYVKVCANICTYSCNRCLKSVSEPSGRTLNFNLLHFDMTNPWQKRNRSVGLFVPYLKALSVFHFIRRRCRPVIPSEEK